MGGREGREVGRLSPDKLALQAAGSSAAAAAADDTEEFEGRDGWWWGRLCDEDGEEEDVDDGSGPGGEMGDLINVLCETGSAGEAEE